MKNFLRNLKIKKNFLSYLFKRKVLNKRYMTLSEFRKSCKIKSKNDLIKELIWISSKINKNKPVVNHEYRKSLRKYSKKQLIDAIARLKIVYQFGGRENAKAKAG